MKIIEPYQITAEILNLIHSAEKYLVLVSPYVKIQNWETIKQALLNAKNKGVNIFFYTRLEPDNFISWEEIESLGITPKLIKNLHAKLYYNEKSGIVTSMNLLVSSNLNAIEFGSIYDTKEDLVELKSFVKRFLEPFVEENKPSDDDIYLAKERFVIILAAELLKIGIGKVNIEWKKSNYELFVKGFYCSFMIDKIKNKFWIKIKNRYYNEKDKLEYFLKNNLSQNFLFETEKNLLTITSKKSFSTSFMDYLKVDEKKQILEVITNIVLGWFEFEDYIFELRRQQKS